jgi:hypothetical protein
MTKLLTMKNFCSAITLFLVALSGCDYYDSRLEIENKTGSAIAVEIYEDTVANVEESNRADFYLQNQIAPNGAKRLTKNGKNGWPFVIVRSKNKRLNVGVYNVDSLKKYRDMEHLINNKMYKWYEFTEAQLQAQNWKISVE